MSKLELNIWTGFFSLMGVLAIALVLRIAYLQTVFPDTHKKVWLMISTSLMAIGAVVFVAGIEEIAFKHIGTFYAIIGLVVCAVFSVNIITLVTEALRKKGTFQKGHWVQAGLQSVFYLFMLVMYFVFLF